VSDPYVLVSFPLVDDSETELVVMTTTPWTLPSNLALCVNAEMEYVKIRDKETKKFYVLLRNRLSELYKNPVEGENYEVVKSFLGVEMKGWKYVPMFDYFLSFSENGAFRVVCDSYVKDTSGTGVVHQGCYFFLSFLLSYFLFLFLFFEFFFSFNFLFPHSLNFSFLFFSFNLTLFSFFYFELFFFFFFNLFYFELISSLTSFSSSCIWC
jgi:hypothetical protein